MASLRKGALACAYPSRGSKGAFWARFCLVRRVTAGDRAVPRRVGAGSQIGGRGLAGGAPVSSASILAGGVGERARLTTSPYVE